MILVSKLNFEKHLKSKSPKVNKIIELLPKLQKTLPKQSLIKIFKYFIRPHVDYGDVISYSASFHQKLETL